MKKWFLGGLIIAGLLSFILLAGFSKKKAPQVEQSCPKEFRLNDSLSNDLSEIASLQGLDNDILNYMKRWEIRGASLAVMRNDSLLYAKGYGWADEENRVRMEPGNIMRIASVSKLLTATGIMLLQERGALSLKDTVFGAKGILCDSVFTESVRDKRVFNITVEHLLRHQGGFTCRSGDPMFSTKDIMRQFHLDTPPDHKTLTRCVLRRYLGFSPGTSQSYSNFGYLLLSMIIEKVSGVPYEDFIRDNILTPAGCYDMHIAHNLYEEKYPNEVRYYMQEGAELCEDFHLNGKMVERCYGASDIRSLSGAGAWCGSPSELCRFVACIDSDETIPDVLSKESVAAMTEYFNPETFSLGWNDTKPDGEWTRTGTLAGSTALVKRYPDGECWVFLTNTGTYRGPHFAKYTSSLFRRCREKYSASFPNRDLFSALP